MARDEDEQRNRRRKREREREEEGTGTQSGLINTSDSEKVDELLKRAEPLIEQVNSLYRQFALGVESVPPNERRTHLEQLMVALQMIHKPSSTYRFRYDTLRAKYTTYRDRWDRLVKDVESGKIQRIVRPKSKTASG